MKRVLAGAGIASLLGAGGALFPTLSAYAGIALCDQPYVPRTESYTAEYGGNGHCTGANDFASWRVRADLLKEVVNTGPIPNDWEHVTNSWTSYSTWAAPGAYRAKYGAMSCTDIRDNWEYKSRFQYRLAWEGTSTVTNQYRESDSRYLC